MFLGECEVREGSIRTLDNNVIELPETKSCDVILAMDCSSAAKFVVKAKKSQDDPKKKVMR